MTQIKKFLTIILFSVILFACNKEDNTPAGSDISGFWIGVWDAGSSGSGTFNTSITQSSNQLSGNIEVRMFADDGIQGSDYVGTIKNKKVHAEINISGIEIIADGDIVNDNTASGTFSVSTLSMNGIFEGEKIPSETAQITEVYKHTFTSWGGEDIIDVICINDRLWLFTNSFEYIDEKTVYKVTIIDFKGNKIGQAYIPDEGRDMSFDGEFIWSSYGSSLTQFDTLGNVISSTELDFNFFDYTSDQENLYFLLGCNNNNLLKTNHSTTVLDTLEVLYTCVENITRYQNHFLCNNENIIYEFNKTGKIIKAYVLPENTYRENIEELITNDNKVWYLYTSHETNLYQFIVYEVAM